MKRIALHKKRIGVVIASLLFFILGVVVSLSVSVRAEQTNSANSSPTAKGDKQNEDIIPIQQPLHVGQVDNPQTELNAILGVVEYLGTVHSKSWVDGAGWYYFENEIVEPNLEVIRLPETNQTMTSNHAVDRNWIWVNGHAQITERVTQYVDIDGTILQQMVHVDGEIVNLTAIDNVALRNTARYTDELWGLHVEDFSLLTELLRSLPPGADVKAWIEDSDEGERYVIYSTQHTGESPEIINYRIVMNYATGALIAWEGGYTNGQGEFVPEMSSFNFQFDSANSLPGEIASLLETGRALILEGK